MEFEKVDPDAFIITNVATEMVLDVDGESLDQGASIVQKEKSRAILQQWSLNYNSNTQFINIKFIIFHIDNMCTL